MITVNTHIHWMVELKIKPDQDENLRTLVQAMVEAVYTNESGALAYAYYISSDHTCHLFERYVDDAAIMAHLDAFSRVFADRFGQIFQPLRFVVYGLPSAAVRSALTGFNPVYMETVGGFRR